MDASKLKEILEQHKLWIETNGKQGERAKLQGANLSHANLEGANLNGANLWGATLEGATLWGANLTGANLWGATLTGATLTGANLTGANLWGANLWGASLGGANLSGAILWDANLTGAILPDISWIIPGCLAQLNQFAYGFYLENDEKREDFIQDSLGFFIQDNGEQKTFDMLLGDRIIRGIPYWVKYSGLKQVAAARKEESYD